jgi:rhodanese-related sulfurtransferase
MTTLQTPAANPPAAASTPAPARPLLTPAEVKACLERGEATLIDVREPMEHARERIDGAKLITSQRLDAAALAECPGNLVILHCQSGKRSNEAARRLTETCGVRVAQLQGGIEAWKKAGLPTVVNTKAPIPIMRQVQIVAGSLVFIGTLLGAFVTPWLLILPAFVGAGLMFAGASGFCGMATLLGKMPWNRVAGTP